MNNLFLAAGVAALAITAPAVADPGKGKGGGAKVERGGGGGGGERAQKTREKRAQAAGKSRQQRAERAGKAREQRAERAGKAREQRAERAAKVREQRAERAGKAREQRVERAKKVREMRAERVKKSNQFANKAREQRMERAGKARERSFEQAKKRNQRSFEARERFAEQRENAFEQRSERLAERRQELQAIRLRELNRDRFDRRFADGDRFNRRFADRGFADCPPGLSVAPGVCMPWGQYKKQLIGQRLPAGYRLRQVPTGLRDMYRDTDDYYYRYGNNGTLFQIGRENNLVRALLPLIGAGLGIGQVFPYQSPRYQVPSSYQSFYPDTQDDYYRYANGYVYEVDRDTGMIEDMIPLLDQGYGVGQMLPDSYSYYNLPYAYRDQYVDNNDHFYRYAPGAIYQVDRQTQLITAVASLLTGNSGLSVGQPLPMGYDAYNVPYQYRDRYNDSPDAWYRYSNGNVYQVDPTTRLITAVVDAII